MKIKDFILPLLIILPLIAVVLVSINFPERAANARDEARRASVNALSRAMEIYSAQNGKFPNASECTPTSWISNCLRNTQIIDYIPESHPYEVGGRDCGGENGYCYLASDSGDDVVIYSTLESLASREYCPDTNTFILYSFANKRTDILCADTPQVGVQRFAK